MPVLPAIENRVISLLATQLAGIGTPSSSYLTVPVRVEVGVPANPVPTEDLPALFIQYVRTEVPKDGESTLTKHPLRIHILIWCLALDVTTMLSLKADVLRQIYASEAAFTASFKQPLWAMDFAYRDEQQQAGNIAGALATFIDVEVDHANP
jgi:hypothetical protein